MCELTYWDEPARLMSLEEFKFIVEQFPKLRFIAMTGIGENFLNKDFMDMYRYVKKKWPHIYIELYDTFYFIDKEKSRILIEEIKIDKVQISFDAATKKTYEVLRKGSDFERVIKNIKDFIEIKKNKKLFYPEVKFHFVINKLNLPEVLDYIELISFITKGTDVGIQFTRMLHKFSQIEDLFVEIPSELIKKVETKGREKGIDIIWNADVPLEKPPVYYCANWMMPFIFISGEVIPCCAMNEANVRSIQKEKSLGNVFRENFRDIWRNEKYKRLRRDIREGKIPSFCFNCPMFVERRKYESIIH